jgi:hypothetical protein
LLGEDLCRFLHLMRAAMAGDARISSSAQYCVNTLRQLACRFLVASGAGRLLHLRMRVFFDAHMAVRTAQRAVHAGFEFRAVNVQAAARCRLHAGIAMANQAVLIGSSARPPAQAATNEEESQPNRPAAMCPCLHGVNSLVAPANAAVRSGEATCRQTASRK